MITIGTIGAFTQGVGDRTAVAGGAYAVGDALIVFTGHYQGSGSPTVTNGSGWTLLSANSAVTQVQIYGKIAASTSETIPTFNWGATSGFAQLLTLPGVDSSLANLISAAERASTTTTNIVGPVSARTPSADNAILLFLGERNKTSTANGTVYSAPANWTIAAQSANSGTAPTIVVAYWIQTTATATAANLSFAGSVADATAQSMQTTMIALGATPPVITPTRSLLGVGK